MTKFSTLHGTSAAGRRHADIAAAAVEAARMPMNIDDFTRRERKGVVLLVGNETSHVGTRNTGAALTNNEDDSFMATQENSSAPSNPQENQHTPGPWEWAIAKSGITFDEEGSVYPPDATLTNGYQYGGPIAVVGIGPDAGGEANGRLIAAAPDLLAACEELVRAMHDYQMDVDEAPPYKHTEMMRRALEVIAKAKGGAR